MLKECKTCGHSWTGYYEMFPVRCCGARNGAVVKDDDCCIWWRERGRIIWFTGPPAAGKTTIANALATKLRESTRRAHVIDAEEFRGAISPGLGFTPEDRAANVQRIGWVAIEMASHNVDVLVAAVSPNAGERDKVRLLAEDVGVQMYEVCVTAPVDELRSRDAERNPGPDGLYARHARYEIGGIAGVDFPFERSEHASALHIDTSATPLDESVQLVRNAFFH